MAEEARKLVFKKWRVDAPVKKKEIVEKQKEETDDDLKQGDDESKDDSDINSKSCGTTGRVYGVLYSQQTRSLGQMFTLKNTQNGKLVFCKCAHRLDQYKLDLYLEYRNMLNASNSPELSKHVPKPRALTFGLGGSMWGIATNFCGMALVYAKDLPMWVCMLFVHRYHIMIANTDDVVHYDITPRNIVVPLLFAVFTENTNVESMFEQSKLIDFEILEGVVLTDKDYQLATPKQCDEYLQHILTLQKQQKYERKFTPTPIYDDEWNVDENEILSQLARAKEKRKEQKNLDLHSICQFDLKYTKWIDGSTIDCNNKYIKIGSKDGFFCDSIITRC